MREAQARPGFTNSFQISGREGEGQGEGQGWPEISVRAVSPQYFETLGLRAREGRYLEDSDDTAHNPVIVINQAAADRLFQGRPALGQAIRFWGTERRIVGVVKNERIKGLAEAGPIALYAPLAQIPMNSGVLLVRASTGDPMALADEVSAAIREADPSLAVYGIERLQETLAGTFAERRFAMLVLVVMAAVTLLLSLFGVHGVLSYAGAQRRREMGIRTALSASRAEVATLILRSGLTIAVPGVALGLILAMAGSRFLSKLLFQVPQVDPSTYTLVAIAALAVALLASWFPARRAARGEVLEALRAE